MEKRALLAVLLSLAVVYAYSFLAPQPQKKPEVQEPVPVAGTVQTTSVQPVIPAKSTAAPAAAKELTVDTPLYKVVLSSQGGSIKSLVLKNYREAAGAGTGLVTIVEEREPARFMCRDSYPSMGITGNELYWTENGTISLADDEKKRIEFVYVTPEGGELKKTYTFSARTYGIDLERSLSNRGLKPVTVKPQILLNYRIEQKTVKSRFEESGPVALAEDHLVALKMADITDQPKRYDRSVQWAGFADKYFLSSVVGRDGSLASVSYTKTGEGAALATVQSPEIMLASGSVAASSFRLYFGPKDLEILKSQGSNLERAIDLGWFTVLAKPLLLSLKFFYHYVHNYGIAIIIITIILKLAFFPLTHKSYKSMKEMQKIQPLMTQLKEKHKNDREAMNRSVMELYKTHKVNPLGGCLPMVVQIPVFFALYKALMFSIELRHAPFFFWITDLSAKDPYYVTPIIMGVTMVVQQKMTPSTMDPVQAKMMMMLPVVFTFMFLNFPSGLVIYWLVNNVLTISQQYYINKTVTV